MFFSTKSIGDTSQIQNFIKDFAKSDNWHELDPNTGNLGYGWLIYSLLRHLKPENILVIGSLYGFIPALCALACRDNQRGLVDFVDANYSPQSPNPKGVDWGGVGYWTTSKSKNTFNRWGLNPYFKLHLITSPDFFEVYPNKTWQYIHLDGDHSYDGIKTDFNFSWPRLSPSGFISLHDIYTQGRHYDTEKYEVHKLWTQLKQKHPHNIELPGTYGLGLIQKP